MVKGRTAPVLERFRNWVGGLEPNCWAVNSKDEGWTLSNGRLLTTSVTFTTSGPEAPVELIVILPVYVFGARPVGFTDTDREAGVVPPVGETASQPRVAPVSMAVVKERFPAELPIVRV